MIEHIPISSRRRWSWGCLSALQNAVTTTITVVATEILPSDWINRRWLLAELRGYRGASTVTASSALITEIRAKGGGGVLLPMGATGAGFGVDAQAGPLPLFLPLPASWSGSLEVDATSDTAANQSFRFMFMFVEVTRQEWEAYVGGCS